MKPKYLNSSAVWNDCRLEWSPNLRFVTERIVLGFGLDVSVFQSCLSVRQSASEALDLFEPIKDKTKAKN